MKQPDFSPSSSSGSSDGESGTTRNAAQKGSDAGACDHCGALVYGDNIRCPQCGKFPIKMHHCPHCKSIAAISADKCWKCGRVFEPDGDLL
jgi:RNA polymerase subunit RPABC4/transcription elongation factor Spt4